MGLGIRGASLIDLICELGGHGGTGFPKSVVPLKGFSAYIEGYKGFV